MWVDDGNVLSYYPEETKNTEIKVFDLDGTLIRTKSKRKFPLNSNDWEFFDKKVPLVLNELISSGFDILVLSNQNGLKNETKKNEMKTKIKNIFISLGFEFYIIMSLKKDGFRKPSTGMVDLFFSGFHGKKYNKENLCYVGDAAGRNKDFSDSDRCLAFNSSMGFLTPEEYFLNKTPLPWKFKNKDPKTFESFNSDFKFEKKNKEMIIITGPPCSGKTSFCCKYLSGYNRICSKELKTESKRIKRVIETLKYGYNIVIDNTNYSIANRKKYIDIAKNFGFSVRCVVITIDKDLQKHLNIYREKNTDSIIKRIPTIAFNLFNKKYDTPTYEEGFEDVVYYNTLFDKNLVNMEVFLQRI